MAVAHLGLRMSVVDLVGMHNKRIRSGPYLDFNGRYPPQITYRILWNIMTLPYRQDNFFFTLAPLFRFDSNSLLSYPRSSKTILDRKAFVFQHVVRSSTVLRNRRRRVCNNRMVICFSCFCVGFLDPAGPLFKCLQTKIFSPFLMSASLPSPLRWPLELCLAVCLSNVRISWVLFSSFGWARIYELKHMEFLIDPLLFYVSISRFQIFIVLCSHGYHPNVRKIANIFLI